jgi:tetratricopeptide (TPR) repeat protein
MKTAGLKYVAAALVALLVAFPAVAGQGKYDMNEGSRALRNGEFALAVEHLTSAIYSGELIGEALVVMHISRAQAYYHLEEYDKAAADLTLAIDSGVINDTLTGIALATRASVYRKTADWPRAIADFDAAIDLGTVNAKMFFHRGLALEGAGEKARALADFRRAHDMAPDNDAIRDKLIELGEPVD